MSRITLCLSFLAFQWGIITCNNVTVKRTVNVSRRCPDVLHRVDYADQFWVRGAMEHNTSDRAWWLTYKECRVTFETTQDRGLCVDIMYMDIHAQGVTLDFLTTAYRPEKHYDKDVSSGTKWCTHNNQMTMVVRLPRGDEYLQHSAFDFVFEIKNKSLDLIEKVYNMGSPADCDMQYVLKAKETAIIKSYVLPTDPAPEVCKMTFTSLTTEKYGQACVWVEKIESLPECDMELEVQQLDTNYWDKEVTYDCKTLKNETGEVCSGDKVLTLVLKRGRHINSAMFELKIASKRNFYWESAESIRTEISVLSAVKSLTVMIATLDTVIVLSAAFISIATRYPYGRLKVIGDMFAKDPVVPHHYGNEYPVAVAVTSGESDPPPF